MKEGFWDTVTNELKSSMQYVRETVKNDFKNVKPYQKEPMKPADVMAQYLSLTEEQKGTYRQTMPGFEIYENKALGLINKQKGVSI